MHFTYHEDIRGDLHQGDVLEKTSDLNEILRQFYPHYYQHSDYFFLIVVTQSCDLERRNEKRCKARYISLAPVRPIDTVLRRELEKFQFSQEEGIYKLCSAKSRAHVKDFLHKLVNNNCPEYFFLATEPSIGLARDFVAILSLSVGLKAELHYQECVAARKGRLKEVFQAKLGWLVGNMYSRVGTPEYSTQPQFDSAAFDRELDERLNRLCNWAEPKAINTIKNEHRQLIGTDPAARISEERIQEILSTSIRSKQEKKEMIIGAIVDRIPKYLGDLPADKASYLKTALLNDFELMRKL